MFLIGQTISLSGTWMQSVAQGWLVYSLTKSPFYLGMVAAAGAFPILFFTLLGGVIADRFAKRNLLLLTQALSIIPALLLGILTLTGVVTVWQVALLAFILGTINAVDIPARQSFLIEMVGRGHVVNAIALNSAVFNGSRIIGPMIAGLSIEYFGMPACFFINAASFVAVIFALLKLHARGETRVKSEGVLVDLMKGIAFIRGDKGIQSAFLLIAVFSLVGLPYISLLPVFAGAIFHRGPQGLGFLMGASGVGALAAALGIAARGTIRDQIKFMSLAGLCFSCALLMFSLSRTFWVSLAVIAVGGWGLVSYLAAANSYIQVKVPDELRGRVMSIYSLAFFGLYPLGSLWVGLIAEQISEPFAIMTNSVILLVIFILIRIFVPNLYDLS